MFTKKKFIYNNCMNSCEDNIHHNNLRDDNNVLHVLNSARYNRIT